MPQPDSALLAGMISTIFFVASYLPMLTKAARTRDLGSYSRSNLVLANAVHSMYVFSLPLGPIWVLHTFYLVSTAIMLVWHWSYPDAAPQASASKPNRLR
jgi:hypothetical protein